MAIISEALKIIEKFKMDSEGEITVTGTADEWLKLISYIINYANKSIENRFYQYIHSNCLYHIYESHATNFHCTNFFYVGDGN